MSAPADRPSSAGRARGLVVTVPDDRMRQRLDGVEPGARLLVWRPDSGPPPEPEIDLAVLPYMVGPEYLTHLRGRSVKVVQSQMLGYERLAEFLPPSVAYCNAVGVHEASTAELALALILASQRGLAAFRDSQRERSWNRHRAPGLLGKRILLVGAGGVGRQIARRLEGFQVDLRLMARRAGESAHGPVRPMAEIWDELPRADIVLLAVPLSPETRGLAGRRFLAAMKDDALLVNVSRGPVVDTDALLREVAAGRLRAAMDVVDPEPLPSDHALWTCEGVLITPHVGGETESMTDAADALVLGQIARLLAGEQPAYLVHAPQE